MALISQQLARSIIDDRIRETDGARLRVQATAATRADRAHRRARRWEELWATLRAAIEARELAARARARRYVRE